MKGWIALGVWGWVMALALVFYSISFDHRLADLEDHAGTLEGRSEAHRIRIEQLQDAAVQQNEVNDGLIAAIERLTALWENMPR